jgi:hypothetical protein
MKKTVLYICFFGILFHGFSQKIPHDFPKTYQIVAIDSSNNYYFIFVDEPNKAITNEHSKYITYRDSICNDHFEINFNGDNFKHLILSLKIEKLKRNISIGEIYDLSLICITCGEVLSATRVYDYIGHRTYILNSVHIFFTKEIKGLHYTQNIDTIKHYDSIIEQNDRFDSQMVTIYLRLSNANTCYSKWFDYTLNNAREIDYQCIQCETLFEDKDCTVIFDTINCEDYSKEGILRMKLLYQYKKNAFILIEKGQNKISGWIPFDNFIERKKKSRL